MRLPDLLSIFRERRSLENPATPLSAPADWLGEALGARKSATGVLVTPENALEQTPVWSAVRLISSNLATLPLHVFRRNDSGKERATDHPVYDLLHTRPNAEMSSFVFRELLTAHLLIWGNAYAEVERSEGGDVLALWPIHPTAVRWQRIGGEKVYIVRVGGSDVPVSADNMLHVPGFSLDGHTGLVPTHMARNAIGLSAAAEAFGSAFFANGASLSGVLQHPGKLGPEAAKMLRDSWNARHTGLSNAQRVAVLEEGMVWQPMAVPPEAAQFIATRQYQIAEVARLFLIPPHMLGDLSRATFSNIEAQSIEFVTNCLEPWARKIEQELNYKLFRTDRALFVEHALEGRMRGDSASRAAFYQSLFNMGSISPNEIRARENMNPVADGDTRFVPMNLSPLGAQMSPAVVEVEDVASE